MAVGGAVGGAVGDLLFRIIGDASQAVEEIDKVVAKEEKLGKATEETNQKIQKSNQESGKSFGFLGDKLTGVEKAVLAGAAAATALTVTMGLVGKTISVAANGPLQEFLDKNEELAKKLDIQLPKIVTTTKAAQGIASAWSKVKERMAIAIETNEDLAKAFNKVEKAIADLKLDNFMLLLGSLSALVVKVGAVIIDVLVWTLNKLDQAIGFVMKSLIAFDVIITQISNATMPSLSDAWTAAGLIQGAWGTGIDSNIQLMDELAKKIDAATLATEKNSKAVGENQKIITDLSVNGPGITSKWGAVFDDLSTNFEDMFANALSNGFSQILDGDWKGGLSNIGGSYGGQVGGTIGEAFGGPIGQAAGQAIGEKLGKEAVNAIVSIFSDDPTPHEKARGAVAGFLHDIFAVENTRVVVEDQLIQLMDLTIATIDGYNSSTQGFFDKFFAATPAAFEGFSAIGVALNELQTEGVNIAGQIAAALHSELGGSLNNLQLLVKDLGFSADQMKNSIVDAFLKSDLSAGEAASSLSGVAKIFEKGIPDGVGLTVQAFENLINSAGRGQIAWDALGDVAAEAIEDKTINNLDDLQAKLVSELPDQIDNITAFFAALGQQGITSLEQLADIGAEKAIYALAELENQGFKFNDAILKAEGGVQNLLNKLEEIDGRTFRGEVVIEQKIIGDTLPGGVGLEQ